MILAKPYERSYVFLSEILAKMIFERLQSLKKNSPKEIQNIKDYDKIMQTIRDFINALLP